MAKNQQDTSVDTNIDLDIDSVETEITPENVVELKTRKVSQRARDEEGKVLRKGKNLSGNTPYRKKIYALTSSAPAAAIAAAPAQVQLILKYMAESQIEGTGNEIVAGAIEAGMLKTKIDPPVLFAYYRRLLEKLGVEHIG
jgi:hypothetical protein